MTRTKQIGVRLTLSNHLELSELSDKLNVTKSLIINMMLEQFFSKNEELIDSILASNEPNITLHNAINQQDNEKEN